MDDYQKDGRKIFHLPPTGETIKSRLELGDICERSGGSGRARILQEEHVWLVHVLRSSQGLRCTVRRFDSYGLAIGYFNRVVGRFTVAQGKRNGAPPGARAPLD